MQEWLPAQSSGGHCHLGMSASHISVFLLTFGEGAWFKLQGSECTQDLSKAPLGCVCNLEGKYNLRALDIDLMSVGDSLGVEGGKQEG